jgi:tetratricopeptide (TPR) repeat protein
MPESVQTSPESLGSVLTELLEMLEQGQVPDREAWISRYPQLAAELEEFFTSRDRIEPWAAPLRSVARALVPTPRPEETPGERPNGPGPAAPDRFPGSLPDYEWLAEIGQGGMGVVYKARQKSLNRLVAVKMIRAIGPAPEDDLRRFRNEAEAVAHLDHAHIVPVHEVGEHAGQHYFTMKLIEGGSLDRQLARFCADPKAAASLLAAVARAVHHAHQRGILHRDLKPGNILVDAAGEPHVTDFGLAKRIEVDSSLTQSGVLIGTPSYMAPEQTSGVRGAITTATDVYGLGALLYTLLCGRPPFKGETVLETLEQVKTQEPAPPSRSNRRVDRNLETICLKCLAKDPRRRYNSAEHLADDLSRWLAGEPVRARRTGLAERMVKWARRRPAMTSALTVAVIALLLGGDTGIWWLQKRAAAQREVELALDEAIRLQDKENWSDALSAARRAEGLLAGGMVNDGLQRRVRERRADLEMAKQLEAAPLAGTKEGNLDPAVSYLAYEKAFREYGIDVAMLDPLKAAERLQEKSIRLELATALDLWACDCMRLRKKEKPTHKELLAIARALEPDALQNRLRDVLERQDLDASKQLAASEEASGLRSSSLALLGRVLNGAGAVKEAAALLRKAVRQHPGDFWINTDLAFSYFHMQPPRLEEAIRFFTVAVALRPDNPGARINLGGAFNRNGDLDGALEAFQEAVRLAPNYTYSYNNLGALLRRAGDLEGAIKAYREGVRRRPEVMVTHLNLGSALFAKGNLDGAAEQFREVNRLTPDNDDGYVGLSEVLFQKGQVAEGLEVLHVGHEKVAARLRANIARKIKEYEHLVALDAKLLKILNGEARPEDAAESRKLAHLCAESKQLNVAAVRFYSEAFFAQPNLANNLDTQDRYNAACAAALAGCGQGKDAGTFDGKERAQLHRQALNWLSADLEAYRRLLEKEPDKARPAVRQRMQHWLQDNDFAGVRGEQALAGLPAAERLDWQKLWHEVEALQQRAQPKK